MYVGDTIDRLFKWIAAMCESREKYKLRYKQNKIQGNHGGGESGESCVLRM